MCQVLMHDNVMKFWEETKNWKIDDGIIDLFSLLDNKITLYLQKWDRTTLTLVIMSWINMINMINFIGLLYTDITSIIIFNL